MLQGLGVLVLAVAARRMGLADVPAALLLTLGFTGVLAAHAAKGLLRSSRSTGPTAAFTAVLVMASWTPILRAMVPGPAILSAQLDQVGASVALPPGTSGRVRLLVRGNLPAGRPAHVAFTLALGPQRLEGTLEHGTTRWRMGEETGRYHVRRSAIYLDGRIDAGVSELSLAQLVTAAPVQLTVEVHRDVLPPWFAPGLALVVLLWAGWVAASRVASEGVAPLAGTALAVGLLTGWLTTPDRATWPAVVSLAFGTVCGIIGGSLASEGMRGLRRRLGT